MDGAAARVEPLAASRNQRRRQETRARLLLAARTLFIERGYHATRPQDIAEFADVGHGTFYLQFADKKACFLAFAEAARLELRAFMSARLVGISGGSETEIREMITALLDYADANPGVLRAALTDLSLIAPGEEPVSPLLEQWVQWWAAHLGRGVAERRVAPDYHPTVAAHMIIGLLSGAVRHGRTKGVHRELVIEDATRFLCRALAPLAVTEPAPSKRRGMKGSKHD